MAALPRLLRATLRAPRPVSITIAGAVALVLGWVLPPLGAVALGAAVVLLVPTGPGVAGASALDRALDVIAGEAGVAARGPRAVASSLAAVGAGTVAVAALRVLWTSEPACGANWLGLSCGGDVPVIVGVLVAVGTWFALPVGAAIAASLDVAVLERDDADSEAITLGGAAVAEPATTDSSAPPPVDPDRADVDELVALVRARFGELSASTRTDVVRLVSTTLDAEADVDDGQDVLDVLEDAIRTAGPAETVGSIGTLQDHVGTIDNLRGKYQRTPKLARGAVEKTAATAVRAAGVPKDVAGPAVTTLLTMPDEDWATVSETLDEVTARFVASPA